LKPKGFTYFFIHAILHLNVDIRRHHNVKSIYGWASNKVLEQIVSTYPNKTLTLLLLLLLGDEGTGSMSFMDSTGEKNGWSLYGADMDVKLDVL